MYDDGLIERAALLVKACIARDVRVATAESCTGGLLAGLLTEVPGASSVLERGFVTYSNRAKIEMLGVPEETIAAHGAVSSQTALAMAEGALLRSGASMAIAVTGIAGPGGGTPNKPVGLVHFGLAIRGLASRTTKHRFTDEGRAAVRRLALEAALSLLEAAVAQAPAPPPQGPYAGP